MLSISYHLVAHGWSRTRVSDGEQCASLTASYISDALGDFTSAVIALLRGNERATCTWLEEPGEYHWYFYRCSEDVQIVIVWFDDWSTYRDPHDHGRVVFLTRCSLQHLARQVLGQLQRIVREVGIERYRERWGTHDFPLCGYRVLKEFVGGRSLESNPATRS